jgi:leader peptidase (prepilin peptidase)/N-methyltransferase
MTTLLTASLPLTWLVPLAGLLGLLFGSFFNVVIYRLPKMLEARWQAEAAAWHGESPAPAPPFTLAFPASHCPHCAHRLAWWENLPVLSWLLLRGRCHACHAAISLRYPMVELTSAGLAAGLAAYFGWGWPLLGAALLTGYLLVLAWIDADTQLLPDCLTLPLLWLGLVFNLLSGQVSLEAALWGAIGGYGVLWLVNAMFKQLRGKNGLGGGDAKLLAALGAWLGVAALPGLIFGAALLAVIAGLGRAVWRRHTLNQPMPFGPWLAIAGWASLMVGPLL